MEPITLYLVPDATPKKQRLQRANITFDQHKEVKPKILALARSKGVDVRTV